MDRTDSEYVKNCLDGSPNDYRFIVQRYQGIVMSCLVAKLGDIVLAEEAAQETFVRAFFSLHKLRKPESLCSWLQGIASRVAKDQIRIQMRHRRAGQILQPPPEEPSANAEHDYGLQKAISCLPESCREVIHLRYYGGLSCNEVAQRLRMPLGTVTKTLSRAYAMLRLRLKTE